MKMNALGRASMNNALRVAAQDRYIVPHFIAIAGRLEGCRVLELGCGRGRGLELLRSRMGADDVVGIDLDPIMINKGDHMAPMSVGDMAALPLRSGAVDAVVDFGALHLVSPWRDVVHEVRRVLRPGGRYYFEQVVGRMFRRTMRLATGRRLVEDWSEAALLAELDGLGFRVEGLHRPKLMITTGLVGDLIGVARLS